MLFSSCDLIPYKCYHVQFMLHTSAREYFINFHKTKYFFMCIASPTLALISALKKAKYSKVFHIHTINFNEINDLYNVYMWNEDVDTSIRHMFYNCIAHVLLSFIQWASKRKKINKTSGNFLLTWNSKKLKRNKNVIPFI